MGSVPQLLRRAVTVLALLAAASCSVPHAGGPSTASTSAGPLTAEIGQFRDNYSKQIIEIQLTNTTANTVTVLAAVVQSPLFDSQISWTSPGAGTELPPGQTKSLPAQLPAASCPNPPDSSSPPLSSQPPSSQPPSSQSATAQAAAVRIRLASGAATGELQTAAAADPFGILARNNAELCVAQAAARVADVRLSPDLEVAPEGRTAVLRLVVTPRNPAGAVGAADGAAGGNMTIVGIGGTTLLEEDAAAPWPRDLRVDAAGPERTLRLRVRPARCDPHAVAEDKVGTLIPLRVTVAGREGILKVDAGAQLRGRIYAFVTTACGRQ